MRVRVLFFGRLKDIVGSPAEDADLSEGARVEDLFERYGRKFPELAQFRPSVAASVNQELVEWRAALSAGDEIAFLPPVSGGASPADAILAGDVYGLTRETIASSEIVAQLKSAPDGAVVMF